VLSIVPPASAQKQLLHVAAQRSSGSRQNVFAWHIAGHIGPGGIALAAVALLGSVAAGASLVTQPANIVTQSDSAREAMRMMAPCDESLSIAIYNDISHDASRIFQISFGILPP
jgi:hypothetical protein